MPKVSQWLPNPVVKLLLDNWQISDITTFESGAPQGVSFSDSPSVNFVGGLRRAGSRIAQRVQRGRLPPLQIANIGDAPQSPISGPGVNNWNTSLYKNFVVHESIRVQFRLIEEVNRRVAFREINTIFDPVSRSI